jgi:hydrogenase maturation protease
LKHIHKGGILIYGYGNPGRQDDGLGPMVTEEIEKLNFSFVDTDENYQLQIEDVLDIVKYDIVIFVDAAVEGREPFSVRKVEPSEKITFTTHAVDPDSVLAVCKDTFGEVPDTWLIGIRGYEFAFTDGVTSQAGKNWKKAVEFITLLLLEYKERVMENTGQKTILIIDDDADLRAAMRIVLEASGFNVGEAAEGEEGLKIAERIKPDAVIVDLMMETIDAGSKVSSQLSEKGFEGPIYLLSSAGDTVRLNIDAQELGLAGIFQKPIDHKILVNTLKKQLKVN